VAFPGGSTGCLWLPKTPPSLACRFAKKSRMVGRDRARRTQRRKEQRVVEDPRRLRCKRRVDGTYADHGAHESRGSGGPHQGGLIRGAEGRPCNKSLNTRHSWRRGSPVKSTIYAPFHADFSRGNELSHTFTHTRLRHRTRGGVLGTKRPGFG